MRHPTTRWLKLGLVLVLVMAVVVPSVALAAGGTFTDDDTSIFEADIEWLASAGVTKGCNPPDNTLFCPDDDVTRGQMAAFMRRFAAFLGAEDGIVDAADHATTADSATTADTAGDAGTLDGINSTGFQPSTVDFAYSADVNVTSPLMLPAEPLLGEVDISTTDLPGCAGTVTSPRFPQARILVTATGYVSGLNTGETAEFRVQHNGADQPHLTRIIGGTNQQYAAFAVQWLFMTDGGAEDFALRAYELAGTGESYNVEEAQITAELIRDTVCVRNIIMSP